MVAKLVKNKRHTPRCFFHFGITYAIHVDISGCVIIGPCLQPAWTSQGLLDTNQR